MCIKIKQYAFKTFSPSIDKCNSIRKSLYSQSSDGTFALFLPLTIAPTLYSTCTIVVGGRSNGRLCWCRTTPCFVSPCDIKHLLHQTFCLSVVQFLISLRTSAGTRKVLVSPKCFPFCLWKRGTNVYQYYGHEMCPGWGVSRYELPFESVHCIGNQFVPHYTLYYGWTHHFHVNQVARSPARQR